MSPDPALQPDEPWEHEVAAALRGMPEIEPPVGFIDRAVDHRPLHAGRMAAALAAVALVALGASLSVGADTSSDDAGSVEVVDGLAASTSVDASLLDDVGDGVLALARQLGFP
ncbi:MAG: hypothetical protein AAF962_06000 [Actinomycetota bacterium]